jgi:hypothetical protein
VYKIPTSFGYFGEKQPIPVETPNEEDGKA